MKRLFVFFICFAVCLSVTGCQNEKDTFALSDLGIEIRMQVGEHAEAAHEGTTLLITDAVEGDSLGVISVAKAEGTSVDAVYDTYVTGDGEKTKTVLSDDLIFVDILYGIDFEAQMYGFVFYDVNTGAVVFGRFFENAERDYVIGLARSIEAANI